MDASLIQVAFRFTVTKNHVRGWSSLGFVCHVLLLPCQAGAPANDMLASFNEKLQQLRDKKTKHLGNDGGGAASSTGATKDANAEVESPTA